MSSYVERSGNMPAIIYYGSTGEEFGFWQHNNVKISGGGHLCMKYTVYLGFLCKYSQRAVLVRERLLDEIW